MKKSSLYLAIVSLLIDLTAIFLGLIYAYHLRAGNLELYHWPFTYYFKVVCLTLPFWAIILAANGLYNPRTLLRGWSSISKLALSLLAGWGIILITLYLYRSPQTQVLPRLLIVYGIASTAAALAIGKFIFTELVDVLYEKGVTTIKTIVIGSDGNGFVKNISENKANGRRIVAQMSKSVTVDELKAAYKEKKFDEIIVLDSSVQNTGLIDLLTWAESKAISFVVVPSAVSIRSSNVEVGSLAGVPAMFFMRSPLEGWGRIYKHIFDFIFALILIVILSPVFLIVAILEKIMSPGPVLFRQERIGQDGSTFYIYKFRSMYIDADERFKELGGWQPGDDDHDPRITPLGRVLRRTNIDELPQLWDILIGKMSLVGPRPEQPRFVSKFSSEIPDYLKRHHVKTGLTGWAQVNGLRGDTPISERVKYDLYYIQNWSIWFDIRIIIATILLIVKKIFGLDK